MRPAEPSNPRTVRGSLPAMRLSAVRRACRLPFVLAAAVAACTAAPGTVSQDPRAGSHETVTATPSAAPRASTSTAPSNGPPTGDASPSATAMPSSTATPSSTRPPATLPAETALEAMLPRFIDAQYLTRRPLTGEEALAEGVSDIRPTAFQRLFALLGAEAADLEAAAGVGGSISVIALRLPGVEPAALVDALVQSTLETSRGGKAQDRTVDGRRVRHVAWPRDSLAADLHLLVEGDVVFVIRAYPDGHALVDDVIATMFDPRLEMLLPEEILGVPTQRTSVPARATTGGDVCSFVCPGEAPAIAEALGVHIDDIEIAAAWAGDQPPRFVVAYRVEGADEEDMLRAGLTLAGDPEDPFTERRDLTVGGKPVVLFSSGLSKFTQALYADGPVLFSIRPAWAPDGEPPPDAVDILEGLP